MSNIEQEQLAEDGMPLDYYDEGGELHVMAACGHRVSGSVKMGEKITLCPNCMLLIRFGTINAVYPERISESVLLRAR